MDEALDLTERSIVFWNQYMIVARDKQHDNTFGDKIDVPRGLQLSQFGFCFYDLAPDEALHVHADVPDARYWSLQLYRMRWFTPVRHRPEHEPQPDADRMSAPTGGSTWWSRTAIRAWRTGSTPRAACRAW